MQRMQYNIAWSMGKARRNSLTDKEATRMPGPGIYKETNQNIVKRANPQWSIKGKYPTEKKTLDVPGPGQYSDQFKKHNSPNYSFGGKYSNTDRKNGSAVPGPGSYKSPTTLSKKGGYLGVKSKQQKKEAVPGPGSYAMSSTFTQGFGHGFGSGKRSSPNLNKSVNNPGPGAYHPPSDFGRRTQGGGFGQGKRNYIDASRGMPGPGQYRVNDSLYKDPKAASIKGRPKTVKEDQRPGPGHYGSKSLYSSPAFSMGIKGKAQKLGVEENPAPGSYNPEYKTIKQSAPGVAFGSPSKGAKGDNYVPGPGQYDMRTTVGSEGPAYGIRGRYKELAGDMKPGPGNYNPKDELVRHGTPGTIMGSSKRPQMSKNTNAPGPGMYDINPNVNKGKQYSFGTGNRDDSLNRQSKGIPGPGTYAQPGVVGTEAKGVIIAGKVKDRKPDEVPGPGAYDSNNQRNAPAYSMSGHRTEDPIMKDKAKLPASNVYNPDDSYCKNRPPTVSFGSRPKVSDLRGNGMPGPGQYQLKTTLGGPNFHIGTKNPEKVFEK